MYCKIKIIVCSFLTCNREGATFSGCGCPPSCPNVLFGASALKSITEACELACPVLVQMLLFVFCFHQVFLQVLLLVIQLWTRLDRYLVPMRGAFSLSIVGKI